MGETVILMHFVDRIFRFFENVCYLFKKTFEDNKKELSICFVSVFIFGFAAHGLILFSKIALHDEICSLYDVTPSYLLLLGRWGAFCFQKFLNFFYKYKAFSIPCYYGFLSFAFLSIIVFICVKFYELNNKVYVLLAAGLMVTNPTILMLFGYIHGVPVFMTGYLSAMLGVYILCKFERKILCFCLSLGLLTFSISLYQANISIITTLILIFLIKYIESNKVNVKKIFSFILYVAVTLLLVMVIYFVVLKVFLSITGLKLVEYSGLSNMGITTIGGYLERIRYAYEVFFKQEFSRYSAHIMFPARARLIYKCVLLIFVFNVVYNCRKLAKESGKLLIPFYLLFVALIPFSVNLLFILAPENGSHHTLHLFSHIFFIIYVTVQIQNIDSSSIKKTLRAFSVFLFVVLNLCYLRYDNTCYQRIALVQSKTISYFTTLATQIKSAQGYKGDMPVVYINEFEKNDSTLPLQEESHFDDGIIVTLPYCYNMKDSINDYMWRNFMSIWCGFSPKVEKADRFETMTEVKEMPSYPDFGSIKIIDGVVIVKF